MLDEIKVILRDAIVVGHDIIHDIQALGLTKTEFSSLVYCICDTGKNTRLSDLVPSELAALAHNLLGREAQTDTHHDPALQILYELHELSSSVITIAKCPILFLLPCVSHTITNSPSSPSTRRVCVRGYEGRRGSWGRETWGERRSSGAFSRFFCLEVKIETINS